MSEKKVAIVPEAPLAWFDNYQCQGYAIRAGRRLSFVVVPRGDSATELWTLIAIETDAGATDTRALFDDHSHLEVGSYPNLPAAKEAGATYLATWEARIAAAKTEPCPCEEIPSSRQTHVTVDERESSG